MYNVSNAHSRLVLVRNFHAGMRDVQAKEPKLYDVLKRTADLFALYWIEQVRSGAAPVRRHCVGTGPTRPWTLVVETLPGGTCARGSQTLADLLEDSYLSGRQATLVRQQVRQLLTELRPDAVALVDAWNFADHTLQSAIGRFDGNVYQALFDWVRRWPGLHAVAVARPSSVLTAV